MGSNAERQALIDELGRFPGELEALVGSLSPEQLAGPFIPGEWSVAQNVHHLVDSHINSYVRCKLMATEESPTFRPYDEKRWAALPDGRSASIAVSMTLLRSLHARWVLFWQSLDEEGWQRVGHHPDSGAVTLEDQLRLYVAHGAAHLAQIQRVLAAQATRA